MQKRHKLLIEDWLPFEAIGAESQRERGASSALPPLYFLHVWWARRPLTASRAAVLASTLPAWSADWPVALLEQFPDEKAYRAWFLWLIGIHGDPVTARKAIQRAKELDIKLPGSPYGYKRAFTYNPSEDELKTLRTLLAQTWGDDKVLVLDPFAGGGSIPFEALRYGFTTIANELNPVAAVILKATLDYPARFGVELAQDIANWGRIWSDRVKERLSPYFPKEKGVSIFAYLWARTVACPETGKPVPLSPNWWLRKGEKATAVRLIAESGMDEPVFQILERGALDGYEPDEGTVKRGVGRSPWTGQTIPGDYIKQEAQAGRMGQMLYAVALKKPGGLEFRTPTEEDLQAVARAEAELARMRPRWEAEGIIPTEPFPGGNDPRPLHYGMPTWADMFSPRQLLSLGTFVDTLRDLREDIRSAFEPQKAEAVEAYLALAVDKVPNYNSRMSVWHVARTSIANTFNRHDYSFAWSHGEFDSSANLLPWALKQVRDSYDGLANLSSPAQTTYLANGGPSLTERLFVSFGDAADLSSIPDSSVHNITADPPYYDNVMYAELSDFFYVWLKRTAGHLFPEFFKTQLTDKDEEAVANPARFAEFGKKKKDLAAQDYERKMAAAFREAHRVLRDDGSLTVMFTHKRVEAWDTLASALLEAGFSICASWPVHTESEHSLHQAKKNAAASTILLACRKREEASGSERVWWEDLQARVRRTAREKAEVFASQGVRGVDLYISVFGPTLSVISERWPVHTSEVDPKTGEPKLLRPEIALDLAREEVLGLRRELLLGGREVSFDEVTDWYLMAWDSFAAEQFPYDEARKLAIGVGVELDKLVIQSQRLAERKGQFIRLLKPWERRARGRVNSELDSFTVWINAAHTAMMLYKEDGPRACEAFLRKTGLRADGTFKALLGALLSVIPRRKMKGKYLRPEAEVLENMRLAFFEDIPAPPEEAEPETDPEQIGLPGEFET